MKLVLIVAILIFGHTSHGHRILGLFPHPGYSHFSFFHPIMTALAEAGHEVTVVSQFPNKEPHENYKDELLPEVNNGLLNFVSLDHFKGETPPYQHLLEFFMLKKWGQEACEIVLNSSALKNVLNKGRREPFDLIIVEMFNSDCMLGIAEKLKAPIIGLSSCNIMPWHATKLGLPYEPGFLPTTFMGYSDQMSFRKRLSNWFTVVYMNLFYKLTQRSDDAYLKRRFGDDFPSTSELVKKVSMVFVNQHYSLTGAKHLSPNVVELGGVHIGKPKTLDPELQKLLDTAKHGIIYISWGSMVKADTLGEEKREGILKALGKFKQLVIWKYENETLPNQPSNVVIRKWLPQREILCHPNVRVFMTHGGLLGSTEAAYCGVPVITTPFYGDQFLNSAALEHRGMGVVLKYNDINEQTLHHALRRVLDAKFQQNAKKVQYSFKHRPLPPKEAAVYWSEYVIATKGAELVKPYSVHANWFVYSGTDIFVAVSLVILAILGMIRYSVKKLFKKMSKQAVEDSNQKKTQ